MVIINYYELVSYSVVIMSEDDYNYKRECSFLTALVIALVIGGAHFVATHWNCVP